MQENLISIVLSLIIIITHSVYFSLDIPRIVFLDVSQGDSAIISYRNLQVLVDAGPSIEAVSKIGRYMNNFDRNIEVVILTHWHRDHYFGLYSLVSEYKVNKLVLPTDLCAENSEYLAFKELFSNRVKDITSNISLSMGELNIEANSKYEANCVKTSKEINNSSIVTNVKFKDISLLLMGDVEEDIENLYSQNIDILKAGHHCSKTSSSKSFIEATSPSVVICSYGKNFYGHPSEVVLKRFEQTNSIVLSTFYDGDILVNLKTGFVYNGKGKLTHRL